ncbi:patatin-like phospholipase RssA [Paraferrimonas haliotis]|uniref:PNPLA domain-containing protein n=1 Tax=Paraferrimonas haliotis TaxID=2013866 RepID=A0AA37TQY8_9GAMM|nr:patatin-like phospholipase RssA [Paraferrimonas haliotis]GLS82632.1 hypothetical protein GCM10007894_06090 [Paraferrimonas haliotis]
MHVKIGIALGSGAAKGWAHIGVIKALEELNYQPSFIAGCSIGALVGAAHANQNLAKLEDWVLGFSSWDVLSLMDFSLRRSGLISGEKVFDALHKQIGNVRIETLAIPFTAVTTDLYRGQEIWFSKGDLRQAVRASCSMPGILAPVELDGRWLVDGAVVNPVPVSTCRAMGADVVIAVDLHGDRRHRAVNEAVQLESHAAEVASDTNSTDEVAESPTNKPSFVDLLAKGKDYVAKLTHQLDHKHNPDPNMMAVMSRSMDILEQRHKRARLMGDPPEVIISPRVSDIGTMEFHRAKEAIDAGYQATMAVRHLIETEIDSYRASCQNH